MEKVAVVLCLLLFTSIAGAAAVDVQFLIDDLTSEHSAILAVGTAVLLIYVGIAAIRVIRRAINGE